MEQPTQSEEPPGQHWSPKWIIYAALDIQKIDAAKWHLKVTGLVEKPLDYSYEAFLALPMKKYVKDFQCVTGWGIKNPEWEGVPIKYLADAAGVKKEATWVMFHCADGYSAPVPLEDALNEDAIVALRLNGKPLVAGQGFPARPFFPQLYGWKSAKWLTEIEFIPVYKDGYWEMYGYHERADVWNEERFKGGSGKHLRRRAFGTVG